MWDTYRQREDRLQKRLLAQVAVQCCDAMCDQALAVACVPSALSLAAAAQDHRRLYGQPPGYVDRPDRADRSPCSTTRTARSRSPRCSLPGRSLPAFAVPAAGRQVEASTRRRELSGLYFFEAIATAALAVLLWHFSLPSCAVAGGARRNGRARCKRAAAGRGRARCARGASLQLAGRDASEMQIRGARAGGRAEANAALNVALLGRVRRRAGARRRGRRGRGRTDCAAPRRRRLSRLRRAAGRSAPARGGGRRGLRAQPPARRRGRTSTACRALRALLAGAGDGARVLRVRRADRGRLRQGNASCGR